MNLIDVNVASYLEMLIYLLLIAEEANFKSWKSSHCEAFMMRRHGYTKAVDE